MLEGPYKQGIQDGFWTLWDENGNKNLEGSLKDGEKVGKWTYYKKDGSVKFVFDRDNKFEGNE